MNDWLIYFLGIITGIILWTLYSWYQESHELCVQPEEYKSIKFRNHPDNCNCSLCKAYEEGLKAEEKFK